jgi:hypothetical protein
MVWIDDLDGRRVIPTYAALPREIKHRDKMHSDISLGAAREANGASREAKGAAREARERLVVTDRLG